MPKIIVNGLVDELDTQIVKGHLDFSHNAEIGDDGKLCDNGVVFGTFETHEYIPDIRSLESDRFRLENIVVTGEHFSAGQFNIHYAFFATKFKVEPESLSQREIEELENIVYPNEKKYHGYEVYRSEEDRIEDVFSESKEVEELLSEM